MTKEKKTTIWIAALLSLTFLLGALIQLGLFLMDKYVSAARAEEALRSLETAISEIELSPAETEMNMSSLAANSDNKALRAEKLRELELLCLVNPWNPLPEGYEPELLYIDELAPELADCNDGEAADARCAENLVQMLRDCRAAGNGIYVCSAYRSHEKQVLLYENKIQRVLAEGYSPQEAPAVAAMSVAVPGTSEHELGLAFDIIDVNYPYLTPEQEQTPGQIWLIEHCWDYGFILRYPNGTSDITGIIYEPWHYRYVGKEFAAEIKELGVTLEEYTAMRRGR